MDGHVDRPKKNSRLESFLLRKMTPASYESVRSVGGGSIANVFILIWSRCGRVAIYPIHHAPRWLQWKGGWRLEYLPRYWGLGLHWEDYNM